MAELKRGFLELTVSNRVEYTFQGLSLPDVCHNLLGRGVITKLADADAFPECSSYHVLHNNPDHVKEVEVLEALQTAGLV